MIEDGIHILTAPLPLPRSVAFPEYDQQLIVCDAPRVVIDLNRLRVVSDIAVIRVFSGSSAIPHTRSDDTRKNPEPGFDSPESPQTEGSGLKSIGRSRIDGRDIQ